MRQNRSKGLISARASEKNKLINKKSQESDISPICPEVPRERIFTKLGKNVPLMDVINCEKFCDNQFKGLNFTGGQSSNFSHGNLTSPLYHSACTTAQPVIKRRGPLSETGSH